MAVDVRQRPTRRQLEVLRAYIAQGSTAAAAHELGIAESTARQHLSGLYRRAGCLNSAQAAYLLGRADLPGDPPLGGDRHGRDVARSAPTGHMALRIRADGPTTMARARTRIVE